MQFQCIQRTHGRVLRICGVGSLNPRNHGRAMVSSTSRTLSSVRCMNAGTQNHKSDQNADVLVILAGGMLEDGGFPEWVLRRLDASIKLHNEHGTPILCTGGWTPHRPAQLYPSGQVLYEASAMAEYLVAKGVAPSKVYKEWASYDTIGNAYYTLTSHVYARGWQNISVLTSEFHMPRSKVIFEWIFKLAADAGTENLRHIQEGGYNLSFVSVSDEGIDPEIISSRQAREAISLKTLKVTVSEVTSLDALHEWFHMEHRCYSVTRQDEMIYPTDAAKYGLSDQALKSY